MKKQFSILALLFLMSLTVIADDGTTHSGGKSCPTNQTSCLVETQTPETIGNDPIYKELSKILKFIFG